MYLLSNGVHSPLGGSECMVAKMPFPAILDNDMRRQVGVTVSLE